MFRSQPKSRALQRKIIMCPTRIVAYPTLARASTLALAVTAWLIFGTMVAGYPCEEVCGRVRDCDIGFRPLSAGGEGGYCSCERRRPGSVDLQLRKGELRGESSIRS